MTAPDHVSIKQTEGYEYNWWGVVTDEFDEDGIEYIRADILAALQAENERLREALSKAADEIDQYIWQEYPLDHPVHERYRQRDFDTNPARTALK